MYNEHYGFSESPFKVTPDPRFFFVNPCYEEAFATLRYGISSRKGMTVVTGEAGTGKTTLLKKLLHSLEANVHPVCIFDPHLSFGELLRYALIELGISSAGEDRLTLMAQFYDYLVRQFEDGQIVVLMIDEAQNLSEEMLEELRLLSNLETDTEKLIQIIFAGQPDFEEKLDDPQLLQLKQRVVLRCRLRPLKAHEVGTYIHSRVKTVCSERQDLFDTECVSRIALYSKGIPRLVNIICDNAMLLAYANHGGRALVEEIDQVARELKLLDGAPGTTRSSAGVFGNATHVRAGGFRAGQNPAPRVALRSDLPPAQLDPLFVFPEERPPERNRRTRSHALGIRIVLTLLIALNAVLVFSAHQEHFSFATVAKYIDKLAAIGHEDENAVPEAARENFPSLSEDSDEAIASRQDTTGYGEPAHLQPNGKEEVVSEESAKTAQENGSVFTRRPPAGVSDEKALTKRKLEFAVYKAIHDRAIRSVVVSAIVDGTVYLDGEVATPHQKVAAVRATLDVPGVKDVRNRINIVE